ncbi:hypothetical protein EVAR_75962_1 [Eumeta japonica]|uniref:PiggyBac transposable element-derived protein domain-containing protein n=1 Tax=Eumeta variegata TaxID=151549 RepID=A0A4C1UAX0_EUMVA|nr:hypothetical protein EVAR_75962_1 [Eumeta japonica]
MCERLQYDYGGIDLKDQKPHVSNGKKEGLKWYIKMFKRLLNTCVHNVYILAKDSHNKRYDEKNIMTHRDSISDCSIVEDAAHVSRTGSQSDIAIRITTGQD